MYAPMNPGLIEAVKRSPVGTDRNRNMSPKYNQPIQPVAPMMNRIASPVMSEPMPNIHPALLNAMRTMPMGPGY